MAIQQGKIMKTSLLMLFLTVISATSNANVIINKEAEKIEFVGYAYSFKDSSLLYTEHHSIVTDNNNQRQSSRVKYTSSEGLLIADKTLEYDEQGYFPNFNIVDLRTNQTLSVALTDKVISIINTTQGRKKIRVDYLDAVSDDVMIADAGFDVFMMKNWQALVAGQSQVVDFLAPTRSMFVSFKIAQTFINDSTVGFSLAPDNFFISLLVDPIYLEYDLSSGRILSYKGLTNIEEVIEGDASGSYVLAHIKYQYPNIDSGLEN
jgi:hypothetical protein